MEQKSSSFSVKGPARLDDIIFCSGPGPTKRNRPLPHNHSSEPLAHAYHKSQNSHINNARTVDDRTNCVQGAMAPVLRQLQCVPPRVDTYESTEITAENDLHMVLPRSPSQGGHRWRHVSSRCSTSAGSACSAGASVIETTSGYETSEHRSCLLNGSPVPTDICKRPSTCSDGAPGSHVPRTQVVTRWSDDSMHGQKRSKANQCLQSHSATNNGSTGNHAASVMSRTPDHHAVYHDNSSPDKSNPPRPQAPTPGFFRRFTVPAPAESLNTGVCLARMLIHCSIRGV